MTGSCKQQNLISYKDLPQVAETLSVRSVLLVSDAAVFEAGTCSEKLHLFLDAHTVKRIDIAVKLLTIESLMPWYNELSGFQPDCIVALGGGTVLDSAKLLNIILSYKIKPSDLLQFRPSAQPLLPVIAVPTTAGTGSEATHFAVVYKDNTKYSIAVDNCIPDYVILDPELTETMPRSVAAYTGFDAFAQTIESYWSINATVESKDYSREALSLITKHFTGEVLNNTSASRKAMQWAAYLSGKAINIAQTTAAHAVSYPMTAYFSIPHGLAVFLILPSVFAFNQGVSESDCADARGVSYVRNTMAELAEMISESGKDPGETLRSYFERLAIDAHLSAYGISDMQDITCILDNGFNPQRIKNNPRTITRADLSMMLQELL